MRHTALALALALITACSGDTKDSADTAHPSDDTQVTDGVSCDEDGGYCVISGIITKDLTIPADTPYLLRGGVFIGNDVDETVLTVEAGATVYGETSTDGMLVITRNSRIIAEGTADAPIVFTSSKEEGSRARGDWGGLILNGNAPVNACAKGSEGCESFGEGGTGWYGGSDPSDDSGVLKYVRVEFAGTLISPENELNGIAFQGVGSGTTIDYIQVHQNADDGIEFFGGTAEARHVVVTAVGDDMLDWTDGWTGKLQYAVLQQWADAGDNGIEADNNGENNLAEPISSPTLSHLTILGSPESVSSDFGMLLREGTGGSLHNIVVAGMNEACLDVDNSATFDNLQSGALSIHHSLLDCSTAVEMDDEDVDGDDVEDPDPLDLEAWFVDAGNELGAADLIDPFHESAPDYAPDPSGAAASGGSSPSDAFFEEASYRGGVDPNDDWTAGWTSTAPN